MNNPFGEISVDVFKEEMQKKNSIVIDIRTKEEWEKY
jgi:rhodanese-related sulfurtransferase